MLNKDEIKGKGEQLKGKVKKAAADLTDDPNLHDEGEVDETVGAAREAAGTARRKVGELVENAGKQIKR